MAETPGLVRVMNNEQLIAQENATAQAAQDIQSQPVIINIAAFVRQCFDNAQSNRTQHELDMLAALRMRSGEYDPDILTEIKKQGGSEVFMRVGSTKMRGAQSWLKDIYLNIPRPWTLSPSPVPDLEEQIEPLVMQQLDAMAIQYASSTGVGPTPEELQQAKERLLDKARAEVLQKARDYADRAADQVDDILVEGGFYKALDECLTDITTFKVCIMKGPVVRMKKELAWVDDPATGKRTPQVKTNPKYTFSRVSPLAWYPAQNMTHVNDGFVIQRHKLFRMDLVELLDTPGFDTNAIRQVLDVYGRGGLSNWLSVDSQEAMIVQRGVFNHDTTLSPTIDALEYWGSIQGRLLLEWGMTPEAIPDPLLEYPCNVWVIGQFVIKAMLNADPLGRVPFSVSSLVKVPGTVWGEGLYEQLKDVSQVCNAASRSLINNMALASGPMVGIDASRLPPGEVITSLRPWKTFQFLRDMVGGSQKPIEFFQPQSNATELMGVFEKFSVLADEYSNIPRYMLGDNAVGGAGRTAAGLSMLMNAANKGVKNVANNIDTDLIVPSIERLYYFLMLNAEDTTIKGDLNIVARGASGLMLKELLNQRRVEFMQQIPELMQLGIIKPEGVAALMREIVKGLEMPQDRIVPSDEEIRQMQAQKAAEAAMAAMAGGVTGAAKPAGRTPPAKGGEPSQDQHLRSMSTGAVPPVRG